MFVRLAKRVIPFLLAFSAGTLFASNFPSVEVAPEAKTRPSGCGGCRTERTDTVRPRQITSKPKAIYTDEARENGIEGSVRLKVAFLSNGQVGSITPITELPYGLTEQAMAAARKIEFEPKVVNGIPVSTMLTLEYRFTIY